MERRLKTSELIEQAKKCATLDIIDTKRCRNCPFNIEEFRLFGSCMDRLIIELCDRLEKAYNDLQECECLTCGNREACDEATAGSDWGCKWQWRGDTE